MSEQNSSTPRDPLANVGVSSPFASPGRTPPPQTLSTVQIRYYSNKADERFLDCRRDISKYAIDEKYNLIPRPLYDFDVDEFRSDLIRFLDTFQEEWAGMLKYNKSFKNEEEFRELQTYVASHPTNPSEKTYRYVYNEPNNNFSDQFKYWLAAKEALFDFVYLDLKLHKITNTLDPGHHFDHEFDYNVEEMFTFIKEYHRLPHTTRWRALSKLCAWKPTSTSLTDGLKELSVLFDRASETFPMTVEGSKEFAWSSLILPILYSNFFNSAAVDEDVEIDFQIMVNTAWRSGEEFPPNEWALSWQSTRSYADEFYKRVPLPGYSINNLGEIVPTIPIKSSDFCFGAPYRAPAETAISSQTAPIKLSKFGFGAPYRPPLETAISSQTVDVAQSQTQPNIVPQPTNTSIPEQYSNHEDDYRMYLEGYGQQGEAPRRRRNRRRRTPRGGGPA